MILLTEEGAKIQPFGWVLIIGFLIVFIFGLIYDKKKSKKFSQEIDKKFEGKSVDGGYGSFITDDNELVMRFLGINMSGYKIFRLDNVAYVMTAWDYSIRKWVFALYDEKRKIIKGQEFVSTKRKPHRTKAYFQSDEEAVNLWELVHKHVPDAKHVGLYFKDIEE